MSQRKRGGENDSERERCIYVSLFKGSLIAMIANYK